jgi:hypothetical protein
MYYNAIPSITYVTPFQLLVPNTLTFPLLYA